VGVPGAGGGVPAFAVKEVAGEVGDRAGQGDGRWSEADPHGRAVGGDVAGGEPADPGDGLGVEQDEQAGEPVSCVQRVVVQQAAGGVPASLVIQCPHRAVPAGGGEGQRGEAVAGGPADEVSGVVAVGCFAAGQPPFEVGLAAGGQAHVLGGEPVEQDDGGADVLVHDGVLLDRGGLAVVPAPQPAQQVPAGIPVQDLALVRVGAGGEGVADEPFETGHLLIAWRQCPGGDQYAAQVREDRGLVQAVQFAMGELAAARGDAGQHRRDGLFGEPAHCCAGRVSSRQGGLQRGKRRADAAVRAGQQFPQPQLQAAAGALARPREGIAGRAVGEGRDSAVAAARLVERAGCDGLDLAAAPASCWPVLAGRAPRQPGQPGGPAGPVLAAN